MAYGSSQARGQIGAAPVYTTLQQRGIQATSMIWPQLTATPDPKPTEQARDQICNLIVPGRIGFCCTMTGTPNVFKIQKKKKMEI